MEQLIASFAYFGYDAKYLFTAVYCMDKYVGKVANMEFTTILAMAVMHLSTNLGKSPINIKRIMKSFESDIPVQEVRDMSTRIQSVLEIQVREGWQF